MNIKKIPKHSRRPEDATITYVFDKSVNKDIVESWRQKHNVKVEYTNIKKKPKTQKIKTKSKRKKK